MAPTRHSDTAGGIEISMRSGSFFLLAVLGTSYMLVRTAWDVKA